MLYFMANAVSNNKRVVILLSSIGALTYSLLSDLVALHLSSTKSFYEPNRAIIVERFHFHKHDQTAGETIAEFDATLRKLATHCQFRGTLEDTLRDHFAYGLRHESIEHRLVSGKTSNIATPWRLPVPWRPLTEIPRLSRVLNLRFINLIATLPKFGKRTAATLAVAQTIRQLVVNSKTPNAITAGSKGISHIRVGRR